MTDQRTSDQPCHWCAQTGRIEDEPCDGSGRLPREPRDITELLGLLRYRILDHRNCNEEARERLMGRAAEEIERLQNQVVAIGSIAINSVPRKRPRAQRTSNPIAAWQADVRDAERYRYLRQATAGEWETLNDYRLSHGMAAMDLRVDAMRSTADVASEFRVCEFCGCRTNARARACCPKGQAADGDTGAR